MLGLRPRLKVGSGSPAPFISRCRLLPALNPASIISEVSRTHASLHLKAHLGQSRIGQRIKLSRQCLSIGINLPA